MTKRLYILRHAKAMPGNGMSDAERPLAPRGEEDAKALGRAMKAKNYQPECAVCSPAQRTKQTLEGILTALKTPSTSYQDIIYDGTHNDIFSLIQRTDDQHNSLIVVGHNPMIHQLAASLADQDSSFYSRLTTGYKPGTLSVFDCDIDNWANLKFGVNKVADVLDHLDYNAPATPARWT